jgi:hypothetical protein
MRNHRVREAVLPVILTIGLFAAASCSDTDVPTAKPLPTAGTPTGIATTPGDPGTPDGGQTPGGSQETLPKECTAQTVLALCVTFDFKGAATIKGSNWVYAEVKGSDLPDSTCAEYGPSTLSSTEVGLPHLTKVIGSQEVEAQFDTTWPPAKTGVVDYPATGLIRVEGVAYEARNSNTTGKLDLNPDGSGKYTLNKLVHTDGGDADVDGSISGTISWTCLDPKN